MARIHFGVIDVPYRYVQQQQTKKGKAKKKGRQVVTAQTTGGVAAILEAHYAIFETFYNIHKDWIHEQYSKSIEQACEAMLMGAPKATIDPYSSGNSAVQDAFKKWLSRRGMDNLSNGVPTKASGGTGWRKGGINHRLAHPYASSNPVRPSFIDTGNFEANVIVFVE